MRFRISSHRSTETSNYSDFLSGNAFCKLLLYLSLSVSHWLDRFDAVLQNFYKCLHYKSNEEEAVVKKRARTHTHNDDDNNSNNI